MRLIRGHSMGLGNEQATSEELAYLAGLWDGEGSFQVVKNGGQKYQARVKMTTTSPRLADHTCTILKRLGLHPFVNVSAREGTNGNNKTAYNVILGKFEEMRMFCEAVLPFLVEKDAHARLLLQFIVSRTKDGLKHGRVAPYTTEERAIVQEIGRLNQRGASTTRCAAPPSEDEGIV